MAYLLRRWPNCTNTDSEWLKSFKSISQKGSIQDISEEATQRPVSAFMHVYLHNERHIHLGLPWKLLFYIVVVTRSNKHLVQSALFRGLTESTYRKRRNEFRDGRYGFCFKMWRIFCILKECKLHFKDHFWVECFLSYIIQYTLNSYQPSF